MKEQLVRCVAVTLLAVVCSTAPAAQIILPTTLDILLADEAFAVVGGFKFDNFTYSITGDMAPASAVNVLPITDSQGNEGLRFQGGFIDTPAPGASDALIGYRVMGSAITDAHLAGNPDLLAVGTGGGVASVTETFLPDVNNDSLTIFDNGSQQRLSDRIVFGSPMQTLQVQKDVLLLAAPEGVGASMSFVDQTFSIPEPTAAVLLGLGAALLASVRRRRK